MGYRYFKSDLSRYLILMPRKSAKNMLRLWVYTPGLWILFFYRLGRSLSELCERYAFLKPFEALYGLFYFLLCLFIGIDLPIETKVGEGLYIGHYGGIVIHPRAVIGKNCNLSHGVTIGEGGRGEKRGVPVIGDRVYIGPGAKAFGAITIGNDVAIGANAVVISSVSDGAVMGGVPARVLNYGGSGEFVVVQESSADGITKSHQRENVLS